MAGRDDRLFWRITVSAVLVPFLCIVVLTFLIAPAVWGEEVAADLGSILALIFVIHLLGVVLFAVCAKLHSGQ